MFCFNIPLIILGKKRQYCSEHSVAEVQEEDKNRVICPLDPKHTVNKFNLEKHLKICNAREPDELPPYINPGCNLGDPPSTEADENIKLQDVPQATLEPIISKVNQLFENFVAGTIETELKNHPVLAEELSNETYGNEKRRHLQQTSSILGIMNESGFLKSKTFFIEYGAGKAALSFWLATAVKELENAKVLVVDRASHRNKKDNQIRDRNLVERIRADIGDLDLQHLDMAKKYETIVGVSKHLCGGATDLALRCIVKGNENGVNTSGFIICVCCHHQCTFDSFVGRDWLIEQGIDRGMFNVVIRMVSWYVCGDGQNREKRNIAVNEVERKEREEIGWKCKRLLDYARLRYMERNGYKCRMSFYADKIATLENICITGHLVIS